MLDQELTFSAPTPEHTHPCTSERHGDWLVFRCAQCPDYERRINWKTGEMQVRGGRPGIMHRGMHLPLGATPEQCSPS